jgi:hypothetical protein
MKRALLIGIDKYDQMSPLAGCVNDVRALLPLLERNDDESKNFDCEIRTSDTMRVTRDSFIKDVEQLLGGGADVALLYFAGHGDNPGNDVALCTAEGTARTPGVEISKILSIVQASEMKEVVLILDCCFSGAAGGVPQLGEKVTAVRDGVTILAASRSDQTAAETPEGRGAFSTFLCGALEGGAAEVLGRVTIAGLYAYLDESFGAWGQRPVLRANLDRLHPVRQCKPAVGLRKLRRLPGLFPQADHELPLDKSYEWTQEPRHEEHEEDFRVLQACRSAKLVEAVGAEPNELYWAAMQEKSCRLTPLGRHYWIRLVKGVV